MMTRVGYFNNYEQLNVLSMKRFITLSLSSNASRLSFFFFVFLQGKNAAYEMRNLLTFSISAN